MSGEPRFGTGAALIGWIVIALLIGSMFAGGCANVVGKLTGHHEQSCKQVRQQDGPYAPCTTGFDGQEH